MNILRKHREEEIIHYSKLIYNKGWVANHDGNLSIKLDDNEILITPTAMSKRLITKSDLIYVDSNAQKLSGIKKPFSELTLHMAFHQNSDKKLVVIHAHPPYSVGSLVAGIPISTQMMAEPVVSLGKEVPFLPYRKPKSKEWADDIIEIMQTRKNVKAVQLQNHGIITVGEDFETAFLRMELIEHLAKIQFISSNLGGTKLIPKEDVESLSN